MTSEQREAFDNAFYVFRDEVHQVAEGVKDRTMIVVCPDKDLAPRVLKHLTLHGEIDNIAYSDTIHSHDGKTFFHHLVIFRDFDQSE